MIRPNPHGYFRKRRVKMHPRLRLTRFLSMMVLYESAFHHRELIWRISGCFLEKDTNLSL